MLQCCIVWNYIGILFSNMSLYVYFFALQCFTSSKAVGVAGICQLLPGVSGIFQLLEGVSGIFQLLGGVAAIFQLPEGVSGICQLPGVEVGICQLLERVASIYQLPGGEINIYALVLYCIMSNDIIICRNILEYAAVLH